MPVKEKGNGIGEGQGMGEALNIAKLDFFLFVSHVSEDRAVALEIVDELERRGVPCWIAPRDIEAGKPFDDEIADALDRCHAMLLIFSERCNDSEYIRREITVAGQNHKVIIPFRIADAQPRRGLRVRLSDLHWIDGFASRERAIDELAKRLDSIPSAAQPKQSKPQDADYRQQQDGPIPAEENSTKFENHGVTDEVVTASTPPAAAARQGKRVTAPAASRHNLLAPALAGVLIIVISAAGATGWVLWLHGQSLPQSAEPAKASQSSAAHDGAPRSHCFRPCLSV